MTMIDALLFTALLALVFAPVNTRGSSKQPTTSPWPSTYGF